MGALRRRSGRDRRRLAGGAAVVLAVAVAGCGSRPSIPAALRSPILEQAKRDGVIPGYRVVRGLYGALKYDVEQGSVVLVVDPTCRPQSAGSCLQTPILWIQYRRTSAATARAILRIAQRLDKRVKIIFGPPTDD